MTVGNEPTRPTATGDRTANHPDRAVTRFTVLGMLAATRGEVRLILGAPKQRLLLWLLLCHANEPVPVATITNMLWGDNPPRLARKNIQVYVSNLRSIIRAQIRHTGQGYVLHVDPEQLDRTRMLKAAEAGQRSLREGDLTHAVACLDRAVAAWRQPVPPAPITRPVASELDRLTRMFLSVYEDWAETKLLLGRHAQVMEHLDALVERYPLRERLGAIKMTVLHRCGRTTEALAHFDEVRQRLARDPGICPGGLLSDLYQKILAEHRARPSDAPGSASPNRAVALRPVR